MKNEIKFIYADLMNEVAPDTIGLGTNGTILDLKKHNIKFEEGKSYWFWRDDLPDDPFVFYAEVHFDHKLNMWVALVNSKTLSHLSESEFANIYTEKDIHE